MTTMIKSIATALLLGLFLGGCSDDSSSTTPPAVASIEIVPTSPEFSAIGQSIPLTAAAYDAEGNELNVSFTWISSDANIVSINTSGVARSVNEGSAMITASASGVDGTTSAKVDLPGAGASIRWSSPISGNWSDATMWSTSVVPTAGDTVAIVADGTYTVTMTEDVVVRGLYLGAAVGIQTLTTDTFQLTTSRGYISGGVDLQVNGIFSILSEFEWLNGDIVGTGMVEIKDTGKLQVMTEDQIKLSAMLKNEGIINIAPATKIDVVGVTLDNLAGALISLNEGSSINVFATGKFINRGDIESTTRLGDGAWISASDEAKGTFVTTGFIKVNNGTLHLSGGDLDGVLDVAANATLLQHRTTLIRPSFLDTSAGTIEITGTITLGEEADNANGTEIGLNNLILAATTINPSIIGPLNLRIDQSLVWRRGLINGTGSADAPGILTITATATANLEGTGDKILSQRIFDVEGSLSSESLINLTLDNATEVRINGGANWTHTGGGTIDSTGDASSISILVDGTFTLNGEGSVTLIVENAINNAGNMNLNGGALTVKGDFDLLGTGMITGGSTESDPSSLFALRLRIGSGTASLAGTIDLDANGQYADNMVIEVQSGASATLASTFKVLIDVPNIDLLPFEQLAFIGEGTTALGGTVELDVTGTVPAGANYQVVSAAATGAFAAVDGDGAFDSVTNDDTGVTLIKAP